MERRFNRQSSKEGCPVIDLQKKQAETKRFSQNNNHKIPDLTDFMNDMFFGMIDVADNKKTYNMTGGGGEGLGGGVRDDGDDFDSSKRSVSSRQTHMWLEEAKRIVASSPPRGADSLTSRHVGSPRFAQGRFSASSLDKRDPLSRSARRNRAIEGTFSGEILSKTAMHTRNRSDTNLGSLQGEASSSPTSEVQKWISNNIKIPNNPDPVISPDPTPPSPVNHLGAPPLPPRQLVHRRSRFLTDRSAPLSQPISSPTNSPTISITKRNFKTSPNNNSASTIFDTQLLSPPKHLVESAHRRSISSSKCSRPQNEVLSPPRNLVESAHRRSISSSTCRADRIMPRENVDDGLMKGQDLNGFLKEQKIKIGNLLSGEINGRAKIVLSEPTNSTSSMVAAICYAWLLENRMKDNKKAGAGSGNGNNFEFVLPVMNIRRGKMWKQRQAAWLFHHAGLDATSLLFSNEVDLENLMMSKQLSLLVVGEDILRTNAEVGAGCTMLTFNYCEDAYDLLHTPILKKLLLAGILLDTKNLSTSPKVLTMTRDAEAVQLLSVASAPNYRNTLFDQLMQDQRDKKFFEVLHDIYGKPPFDKKWDSVSVAPRESRISEKNGGLNEVIPSNDQKHNDIKDARTKKASPITGKPTPPPVQTPSKEPPRKNFFQKLFAFGSR